MAKLDPVEFEFASGDWKAHSAELERLQAASDALPEGILVGGLLSFPVADGYAYYLVRNNDPLTLQHVPFGDAWTIPTPYVRGLEPEDVIEQLARRRRFQAHLAAKRAA